jgi:hypothetical protein
MFISNFEKNRINSRIQSLEICVDNLTKALSAITDQLTEAKQKKPRRVMSVEARANISAGKKAAHARRKAAQGAA